MSAPVVVLGNARALPLSDCSVDAIVCDPPYELAFMGRSWDSTGVAFDTEPWEEALRVLKPGGHLAAFGAPRTYHRVACAIEDAGFEMRDSIGATLYAWVHGQGMPKNAVAALKPSWEPIVVARKPFRGSMGANIAQHGTGGYQIDAARVAHRDEADLAMSLAKNPGRKGQTTTSAVYGRDRPQQSVNVEGRWPTNVVLAHHPDCGPVELPGSCAPACQVASLNDRSPGAARYLPTFRYEAKAPKWQRPRLADGSKFETVKPLDLMRWLVRLLTPPGGTVLDAFPGSGTTGQAAQLEGFDSILVELEPRHVEFIRARLARPVRVDPSSDEAVLGAMDVDGAPSLFDLGSAS